MSYPTLFQRKTLWNAATGLAMLTLGALVVGLVWLLGQVFGFLQPVLVPLIVAGIIAYVLDPVVVILERRAGLSRMWSVVTVFCGITIIAVLLAAALIPGIQRGQHAFRKFLSSHTQSVQAPDPAVPEEQLESSLVRALHDLRDRYQDGPVGWLLTETDAAGSEVAIVPDQPRHDTLADFSRTRGGRMLGKNVGVILETGHNWLTIGGSKLLGFLGLVLGMIMVPVYLFFFLKESASIRSHWHDYMPLKASRFKTSLVETLEEINGYLVSFFRGQVLVAAIDGFLVGVALTIFGLPYGLLIGVFMAILGVIPYIGNILCLIPACIIGYLHAQATTPFGLSPWAYVGCVVGIFVVVQQINSLVTAPKIVGDSVGLHPLTVIFSMLFWSLVLGGFVGALLAVPLTAAVKVLFRRYIWERQIRESPTPLPSS